MLQPFKRIILALMVVASLNVAGLNQRAAYAEQDHWWCTVACGLGTAACCIYLEALCGVCAEGASPCIDYCNAHT
jgi:hypothetical protein